MHPPLKFSFISTVFLMISAFFSSVKRINNKDDQVKEKFKKEEDEGFFNKLEFKFIESHYMAIHVTKHFMCITYFILLSSLFFTTKTVHGYKEIKHIN